MTTSYAKSVQRAVDAIGSLAPYREIFDELPVKVLAMHPLDVVALVNASILPRYDDHSVTITATTLDFEGYGVDAAQDLVRQLRAQHPDFDPAMAMLCRASQLDDMYGSIWGPLLAEVLVHPQQQPVLYQMLFGGEPGAFHIAQRHVTEHLWVARMRLTIATFEPMLSTITEWQLREERALPHGEAAYTFQHITGEPLPAFVAIDIPPEFLRKCPEQPPSS